jgi:hypothetical protein
MSRGRSEKHNPPKTLTTLKVRGVLKCAMNPQSTFGKTRPDQLKYIKSMKVKKLPFAVKWYVFDKQKSSALGTEKRP